MSSVSFDVEDRYNTIIKNEYLSTTQKVYDKHVTNSTKTLRRGNKTITLLNITKSLQLEIKDLI